MPWAVAPRSIGAVEPPTKSRNTTSMSVNAEWLVSIPVSTTQTRTPDPSYPSSARSRRPVLSKAHSESSSGISTSNHPCEAIKPAKITSTTNPSDERATRRRRCGTALTSVGAQPMTSERHSASCCTADGSTAVSIRGSPGSGRNSMPSSADGLTADTCGPPHLKACCSSEATAART